MFATLEGVLSCLAFYSALAVAVPIMPAAAPPAAAGSPAQAARAAFSVLKAVRSGAALALGTPFFLLAARCAILALGRLKTSEIQQPRLGFPMPAGLDADAMLDLYVVGLSAVVLGVCVPGLEVVGSLLGIMLKFASVVWAALGLFVSIAGVYLAVGAWLSAGAPTESFSIHTRPTKAVWGLCAVGHAVVLAGSFYSPDVERSVGFSLGLVHIVKLLQLVFSYPGGAGAGAGVGAAACEEGGVGDF